MSYLLTEEEQNKILESFKKSARVATTVDINLGVAQPTIDGVALALGDRVLVKDQVTGSENGIYKTVAGLLLERASDGTSGKLKSGALLSVEEGTLNSGSLWNVGTPNPITVGVTSITFEASGGGGGGDVTGPGGVVDGEIAVFDGATGKTLRSLSNFSVSALGVVSTPGKFDVTGTTTLLFDGSEITDCLDDDSFSADSNTAIATQQSTKAYVDNNNLKRDQIFLDSSQEVSGVEATRFLAQFSFLPSDWAVGLPKVYRFGAVLSVSDISLEGEILLYNVTDSEFVTLTGGALTTSSTGPVKLESGDLVVGAAAGNLKNTEKVYEIRITNDGTLSSEKTFLGSAWILIN